MALTTTQKLAYRLLGARARRDRQIPKLAEALSRARMPIRAEAYLATVWVQSVATAAITLLLSVLAVALLNSFISLPSTIWLAPIFLPFTLGFIAYIALGATPASNAKKRGRNIEQRLPYAANYIAAMASAGIVPQEIFSSLARQSIYGEVARESAWIYKDMHVHGKDILTALRRGIDRSPSVKFQELLQGAISTIGSGGDLTAYFRQKANRYQWENRVEQKTFIETMGLMAETYVTVAVAGPLFLLVMMAIIVLMGSGDIGQLQLIIYLLLPVINIGFMFGLRAMIPEV